MAKIVALDKPWQGETVASRLGLPSMTAPCYLPIPSLRIGGRNPRAATGHLVESEAKARVAAFEMRAEPRLKMLLPANDLAWILAINAEN